MHETLRAHARKHISCMNNIFYKISKLSKDLMLKTGIILGTISCIKFKLVHEIYYL